MDFRSLHDLALGILLAQLVTLRLSILGPKWPLRSILQFLGHKELHMILLLPRQCPILSLPPQHHLYLYILFIHQRSAWISLSVSTFLRLGHGRLICYFVIVQSGSHVSLWPMDRACQVSLSFTIPSSQRKFMSIESVMLSNHLTLSQPFLLLPPVFSSIRVFSNELALCIRWLKFWSFSFNISPFSEYSGLIPLGLISLLSSGFSQESFPALPFKSVNYLALRLLYGSTHICM